MNSIASQPETPADLKPAPPARVLLSVLVVEDRPADAQLLILELRAAGFDAHWTRAETEEEFLAGLDAGPELIIADLSLPQFSGLRALELMRERRIGVPLIIVTGESNEENAVAVMQAGAADYLNKDRLARFGGAVRHALERRRATEEAASLERQSRAQIELQAAALEAAAHGISISDREGTLLWVNAAYSRITGYPREEALGRNSRVLKSGQHEPAFYAEMWATIVAGKIWHGELINRRKDGTLYPEEMTITPVRTGGGEITHFVAIKQDITGRRQTEAKLHAQARLLDLAQDAIVVRTVADRRILFWNRGAENLYGWRAEEVLGRDMCERLMADLDAVDAVSARLAEKGEWRGELRQTRKDGEELMVSSRATLVRGADGEPDVVLVINTDITQQKKLETQFLRAQRLESIGTLASGVAHDLNNILTPILMSAPALRGKLSPASRDRIIGTVEAAARRGTEIVKQVLTFARGVDGQRLLLDPRHLIEEMAGIARETFSKAITITPRFEPNLWPLTGDPTQLHQVLLNLAVNARDAMPEGGNLILSAENFTLDENYASMTPGASAGSYVLLKVTDTGVGIPQRVIDRIFDPFFTTKEVGQGTGLGLSTVLGIVKSHGGFVNVYSEPGRGTTFKVFLAAAPGSEIEDGAAAERALPTGRGELVLMVDDEEGIRTVTETILRQHGYEVLLAGDGTEAIALYTQYRAEIKVVLTDVVMPFFDGVALTRALKRIDPGVRVIASSGHSNDNRVAALEELGIEAFLIKPYHAEKLLHTLHTALATDTQ